MGVITWTVFLHRKQQQMLASVQLAVLVAMRASGQRRQQWIQQQASDDLYLREVHPTPHDGAHALKVRNQARFPVLYSVH